MGRRVSFMQDPKGLNLRDRFEADYPAFRKWALRAQKESWDEYDEEYLPGKLVEFLSTHAEWPGFASMPEGMADALVIEFLIEYDALRETEAFEGLSPWCYTRHYTHALPWVQKEFPEIFTLFRSLTEGRSLSQDGHAQDIFQTGIVYGYLSDEEKKRILTLLHSANPDTFPDGLRFLHQVLEDTAGNGRELVWTTEY